LTAYELKLILTMSMWSQGLFPPPSQHSPSYHHPRQTQRRPPADTSRAVASRQSNSGFTTSGRTHKKTHVKGQGRYRTQ